MGTLVRRYQTRYYTYDPGDICFEIFSDHFRRRSFWNFFSLPIDSVLPPTTVVRHNVDLTISQNDSCDRVSTSFGKQRASLINYYYRASESTRITILHSFKLPLALSVNKKVNFLTFITTYRFHLNFSPIFELLSIGVSVLWIIEFDFQYYYFLLDSFTNNIYTIGFWYRLFSHVNIRYLFSFVTRLIVQSRVLDVYYIKIHYFV